MKKVAKIRFFPNQSQVDLINETLGCCRYIQNKYIEYNQKIYKETNSFVSGYDFSRLINKLKKNEKEYQWITKYSSKAVKDAIMAEEKAFKTFFKKKKGFPKYKSRKKLSKESFFFVKDNIRLTDNKYIISIPILGKIRITEYGYIPDISKISSGRVIKERNKYYVSFIYNSDYEKIKLRKNLKIGIDLGVKNYATIYSSKDERIFIPHFKDEKNYQKIQNKIIYFQQIISHKAEINYGKLLNQYLDDHNGKEPSDKQKRIMKGESYQSSRIRGIKKKLQKLQEKIKNIRKDFIQKLIYFIVTRIKPQSITIENLFISNMLQKHSQKTTHKSLQESSLYYFRQCLINKCLNYRVQLKIANQYYASSKICSCCGHKNKDLELSDRIFVCPKCGFEEDRDMNAAINLCNIKKKDCVLII